MAGNRKFLHCSFRVGFIPCTDSFIQIQLFLLLVDWLYISDFASEHRYPLLCEGEVEQTGLVDTAEEHC